jgi:hypothetical protein
MIYCKLENINNEHYWMKLIHNLKRYLSSQTNLQNKILILKIQEIVSDDSTMIPKLEFKKD